MRDILTIPLSEDKDLVIASDNSGSIGMKKNDAVQATYETVGYSSFRVAVMECMSAKAEPFSVIVQNFCGDKVWRQLLNGIEQGISELGKIGIEITGSTESNFALNQSAVGITVLGKKKADRKTGRLIYNRKLMIAVIGSPLVGHEVIDKEEQAVPLAVFSQVCTLDDVVTIPVGSKGILYELNTLFADRTFTEENLDATVPFSKSAGPSTCFVAVFPETIMQEMMRVCGRHYHQINVKG